MADVMTREEACELAQRFADEVLRYGPLEIFGPVRHELVAALTRPAPQPSDVDDLSTLSREHLIWRVTNWRRCFEQQQERAHRAEAELARLAATQGAVPEGWSIVPDEPTKEMRKAASDLETKSAVENYGGSPSAEEYWHAMISAAPEVPR